MAGSAAANEQRFPGQTADAETGWHDNWHRTYDPSLGRYLQSDPIGIAAGFNTYGYAGGNPVMYADPTGEIAFIPFIGFLLNAYGVADFGLRWYDNYRGGGCTDFWGSRPEISPWDVAFLLAGPLGKAGKLALGALGGAGRLAALLAPLGRMGKGLGKKLADFLADESGSFKLPPWGGGAKGLKRGPKIDPNAPHNKKIREKGDQIVADGGEIIGGGGRLPEKLWATPGGHKTGRRPDVLYRDSCGNLRGCNVGLNKKDGSPYKREQ